MQPLSAAGNPSPQPREVPAKIIRNPTIAVITPVLYEGPITSSKGRGFNLPLEGATKPSDPVSPVGAQHSTISYHIVENMNRRTAEQGTAEYRSEKHCLNPFKNFCCSKFLVRYLIFKIK
jgi:hypothetical protein